MIITVIFEFILNIVSLILSFIPEIKLNVDIGGYVGSLADTFAYLDSFVSLKVLTFCISSILIVDNFSFILKIFNFIWSKIPFIN